MTDQDQPVRAFVSYSWTNPTHSDWVLKLASRLREDGVDVKLDKWDLKTGDDSFAFMESMVTDPEVSKVIIVCDAEYARKADARSGGVGTETQILTPELYGKKQQEKFAAIITDTYDDGSPTVPTFYKGRIYIDFSDSSRFEDSYEELLRWLIDKPLHVRPELGKIPSHILSRAPIAASTNSALHRAEAAIRTQSSVIRGNIRAFRELMISELSKLLPSADENPIDERVIAAADLMRPFIRQVHQLAYDYCRYDNTISTAEELINIVEAVAKLTQPDESVTQWTPMHYEAFEIASYELMLGLTAIFISEGSFEAVARLIRHPYLIPNRSGGPGPTTQTFRFFNHFSDVWNARKQRLAANRISLRADYLRDHYHERPTFEEIMQADFVLFIVDEFEDDQRSYYRWYPDTLVFAANRYKPSDIFARSESRTYFERWFPLVVAEMDHTAVRARLDALQAERGSRMFSHWGLPITRLANAEHLCIKP